MKDQINFTDFAKLDMRVGEVLEAKEVEGSTKLLELKVNFGEEVGTRTIYAGVREWYEAGKMAGRRLAFVVNLAPKTFKVAGKEYISSGMLVAADFGGKGVLYNFDESVSPGAVVR